MVESKKIQDFITDLGNEAPSNKDKYESTISMFLKTCGVKGKNFDEVWKTSTPTDKKLVVGIYDTYRNFKDFQEELKKLYKQLQDKTETKQSLQQRFEFVESEEEEEQKTEQIDNSKKQQVEELKTTVERKMEKLNQGEKRSTRSEKEISIERMIGDLKKSHPKTMNKFSDISASFSDTFRTTPRGSLIDPIWFKINKKRAKIYDRVKEMEKQQMLTATEHNKLLYKEASRNGGQHGADLCVVENKHGIEEYRVKYPTIDQMLNTTLVQQYAFDLAQKRHLTFVQTNLLNDILKSGGSIVVPNIEFLKEAYQNKQSRGEGYQKEFQEYQNALVSQIGKQVAYNGEQQWKVDVSIPTKNFATPALQQPLQKPTMIDVSDVLIGIDNMVDYISKLSGNLNQLQLSKYKQVDDVFSSSIVTRKEPTTFKPLPGMSFKLRELMC